MCVGYTCAYQIQVEQNMITMQYFFDGRGKGQGRTNSVMGRTVSTIVVGGAPIVKFKEGVQWGHRHESMRGYIDGLRVPRGFREGLNEIIYMPQRRFEVDVWTIALW